MNFAAHAGPSSSAITLQHLQRPVLEDGERYDSPSNSQEDLPEHDQDRLAGRRKRRRRAEEWHTSDDPDRGRQKDEEKASSLRLTPSLPFSPSARANEEPSNPGPTPPASRTSAAIAKVKHYSSRTLHVLKRHLVFCGPGIVQSVAYADPGNYATSLAAGGQTGYRLLFIVLLSALFAVVLQVLCCRLGIVTGLDLAKASRAMILGERFEHDPHAKQLDEREDEGVKRYKELTGRKDKGIWIMRRVVLWGLYLIAECAIIATELAELVGSAIALNLLFPQLPLWGGVLLTSVDVFLILLVYRPERGTRMFELLIASLVIVTLVCFVIIIARVQPSWPDVFEGFLPSNHIISPNALYLSVGILGATVMPHALFLGSHFSTMNRMAYVKKSASVGESDATAAAQAGPTSQSAAVEPVESLADSLDTPRSWAERVLVRIWPSMDLSAFRARHTRITRAAASPFSANVDASGNNTKDGSKHSPFTARLSLDLVRVHLPHATVDIVFSLLSFALIINAAILITAGASLYGRTQAQVGDLYDAYNLLSQYVSEASAILFAIALLASAQSASITVTLSGQIISEGFIRWRLSPFTRRVLTRLLAMIPSLAVAAAVGRNGLSTMLVASQVTLSMTLPFVTLPLLLLTTMKRVMKVKKPAEAEQVASELSDLAPTASSDSPNIATQAHLQQTSRDAEEAEEGRATQARAEYVYFQTKWPMVIIAFGIFAVICIADVYVLATSFN